MARFQKMIFKFALMIALGMAVHFPGSTWAQGKGKGLGAANAKVDKGKKHNKKKDDKKPPAGKKEQLSKAHKQEGKALAHGKDKDKGKGQGLARGKDKDKGEGLAHGKDKDKGKGHGLAHGKDKDKGKGHGLALGKDAEKGEGHGHAHGKDADKGEGHGLALGKEKRKRALAVLSAKQLPPEILEKAALAKARPGKVAKERRKHLKRVAKIRRLYAIAQEKGNTALLQKTAVLRAKEKERYEKAMKRLAEKKSHKG